MVSGCVILDNISIDSMSQSQELARSVARRVCVPKRIRRDCVYHKHLDLQGNGVHETTLNIPRPVSLGSVSACPICVGNRVDVAPQPTWARILVVVFSILQQYYPGKASFSASRDICPLIDNYWSFLCGRRRKNDYWRKTVVDTLHHRHDLFAKCAMGEWARQISTEASHWKDAIVCDNPDGYWSLPDPDSSHVASSSESHLATSSSMEQTPLPSPVTPLVSQVLNVLDSQHAFLPPKKRIHSQVS